ncbi:aldehyde dehydrogenase family protein [Clostridium estertheticum]|uniref:aldehyde dehydrogenase family protein n=1 Tax=Clostridium estertheticum TaxID=238834 RepID=UPI001CF5C980|nr:aldehyde dehydrogenase family protein [Clostridium estertheticum]MCB2356129.1 aldehyde dehydrogenase EutE [Clostridium estertheticum]WAG43719.1 aldehyde dehydrogenase EutE [Clostridium estertheticum]
MFIIKRITFLILIKFYNKRRKKIMNKDNLYLGVFEDVEIAISKAIHAQKVLTTDYKEEDRERLINSIRKATLKNKETLAKMIIEETNMGRYEDKILKHELAAKYTPGTEDLTTTAWSGDQGLTVVKMSPYGVIGAITPSTNPTETVICNSIGMIAAGNSVVFNGHPGAKKCVAFAVDMINRAILSAGGPANLVTTVKNPTMESLDVIMKHPSIKLLCGTGGPGLIKTLLNSGKKAIGAGSGNPPVIVDDTADIKKAAKSIIDGCSFDNNLPCIAEKEVFVFENVANDLINNMLQNNSVLINKEQVSKLLDLILIKKDEKSYNHNKKPEYNINKKWVGKDAKLFLDQIDVEAPTNVKCIICEVDINHPFVMTELMMPILSIVRVKDIDEAIECAKIAEQHKRHSAYIYSKNIDNLNRFETEIDTTIFVKNAKSFAGVGSGAEGFTTFTIAGPTGEGITSARDFTRQRRCVLVS